jgi:hypothetical protein
MCPPWIEATLRQGSSPKMGHSAGSGLGLWLRCTRERERDRERGGLGLLTKGGVEQRGGEIVGGSFSPPFS